MPSDLRSFLELLDGRGLLIRVERRVDPATEAAALMREIELRGVAGLFTNLVGSSGSLAYNLVGTRELLALAMECDPGTFVAVSRRRSTIASLPFGSTTRRCRRSSESTNRWIWERCRW